VLAAWTARHRGWRVITQNVDDLHVRAGTRNLIRLHGSLWALSCSVNCPGSPRSWPDERVPLPEPLPHCLHCGALARPAVVWFGESLDPADLRKATDATACDVFIAAGTSAIVYPAAGLLDLAHSRGAFTVEINVEATPASPRVDLAIRGPVETVFAGIEADLAGRSDATTAC
jgi:NAD-dependent deacetylase